MKTKLTKRKFRELEGEAYKGNIYITQGNEQQIKYEIERIKKEMNKKYIIID